MEMPGWPWMLLVLLLGGQRLEYARNRRIGRAVARLEA
jgi:hypothetical protein